MPWVIRTSNTSIKTLTYKPIKKMIVETIKDLVFRNKRYQYSFTGELGRMQILDVHVGLGLGRRKNSVSLFKIS